MSICLRRREFIGGWVQRARCRSRRPRSSHRTEVWVSESIPFKYRAFLSYSHRDRAWGKWLHHALEATRIDNDLVGRETFHPLNLRTPGLYFRIGPPIPPDALRSAYALPEASDMLSFKWA